MVLHETGKSLNPPVSRPVVRTQYDRPHPHRNYFVACRTTSSNELNCKWIMNSWGFMYDKGKPGGRLPDFPPHTHTLSGDARTGVFRISLP